MASQQYTLNNGLTFDVFEQDPFIVTPYSLYLANHFPDIFGPLSRQTVLDFGAGCGFQALVAAFYGAGKIYAVDLSSEAVALTRQNFTENRLTGLTEVCNATPDWQEKISGEVDLIVSNPASLPSPDQLSATFWAGEAGNSMIFDLIDAAQDLLASKGSLIFIHTSLVCLRSTLNHLREKKFHAGIVRTIKLPFRAFYFPLIPYWEKLRAAGKAFYIEENGSYYEFLYLMQAKKIREL